MSFVNIKFSFYFFVLSIGFAQSTNAFFPLAILSALNEGRSKEKNLILILDVKQQEHYLGACGYTLAVALKDKISPIIASSHALSFVASYFRPEEWFIYKAANLILFIPKDYLHSHGLNTPQEAGFALEGWGEVNLSRENISGSEFYCMLQQQSGTMRTFQDLSNESTKLICQTFQHDKNNRWKIYAVGHGAPDSSQVCGLNVQDFRTFLDYLDADISTNFFIYQTCFGGSKNQLRDVYKVSQDIFKKFSFPIISGSLTNSVSFGMHPDSGITFKGLFSRVDNSFIMQKKTRRLLKAVNELNKCLDLASNYHWSNNLLLLRWPNTESFEPIVDNKTVFKLSDLPPMDDQMKKIYSDKERFKCLLIDKPIINISFDLSEFANFIIASGISRSKHFIKEIRLPYSFRGEPKVALGDIAEIFNSLAFPEKGKIYFIETITIGNVLYKDVMIEHKKKTSYYDDDQKFLVQATIESLIYRGEIIFSRDRSGKSIQRMNVVDQVTSEKDSHRYLEDYKKAVQKHVSKKHQLPFGLFAV